MLQELLLKLVEDHYPLPPDPDKLAMPQANGKAGASSKAATGKGRRRKAEGVNETLKGRKRAKQKQADCNGFEAPGDSLHPDTDISEHTL